MNKQQTNKLAKALAEFLAEYFEQKQELKLEVEEHNFRVDSTGWKKIEIDGYDFLENPEQDIWEMINCDDKELNGEQLFTWDAAMRETKKAGKRMPTNEEWDEILKNNRDNLPNIKHAGFRDTNGSYGPRSRSTYLWSSTQVVDSAWTRRLSYTHTDVDRYERSKAYGFSVRCLRD